MPNKSSIEWVATHHPDGTITPGYTSNPVYAVNAANGKRGHHCVHKNPLCENCYAEAINLRWGTGLRFIAQNSDKVRFALSEKELDALAALDARLAKKNETAKVFMFDMTDIGLPGIPRAFIFEVLDRVATFKALTIQLLTKRAGEMLSIVRDYCRAHDLTSERFKEIFSHVHMGLSVGTQRTVDEDVPSFVRLRPFFAVLWLSVEPLLEPVNLESFLTDPAPAALTALSRYYGAEGFDGTGSQQVKTRVVNPQLDWAVIGGESGGGARGTSVDAIMFVSTQFELAGVPRFVKQMGSKPVVSDLTHWRCRSKSLPDGAGYLLKLKDAKGGDPEEWPATLRVREFPKEAPRA